MSRSWEPLRHRSFRLYAASRTISVLGNAVAPVAVAFAVLDRGGSAAALGLVLAARTVPQVLLVLLGGVVADRFPRQRVLVLANSAGAATQAVTATLVLTGAGDLWHLALLQAAGGASTAFIFPAAGGITAQTVPATVLQQANALLRIGVNLGTIGGAAAGGVLVAAVGPGYGLAVDAVTFGLGALLVAPLRLPRIRTGRGGGVFGELREGWAEFRSRTWLWVIVLAFSVLNACWVGTFGVLGPVIADDTFGRSWWGFLLAAESLGLVVGGVVALRLRMRRPLRSGMAGCLLAVPFMVTLAVHPAAVPLLVLALLMGIGIELFAVAWETSLQEHIPERVLSRVYSYDMLGSLAVVPVGQIVAGPVAGALGVRTTLLGAAGVVAATVLAALADRSVRGLRRADTSAEAAPIPA